MSKSCWQRGSTYWGTRSPKRHGNHGDPLEALAGACSRVQGPLEIEYQVLQQELGPGATDLSSLQFEALQIGRMLFGELGLTENTGIISP